MCQIIKTENGAVFICRGRNLKATCAQCGHPSTKLCDGHAPLTFGVKEMKTCDRPLCERCAVHVHPNLDYCREHAPK